MTQTTVVRCEACHEVGTEEQDAFLAHASTGILHIHAEYKFVIGHEIGLVHLEIAIFILIIAQAITECPLEAHLSIVVVGTFHGFADVFGRLVVVVNQRVYFLRIGVRHTSAEVGITTQEICQGIATIITREKDVHHRLGQRFDIGNDAGTATVQYQYNRLAGLGQCLHEVTLVLAESKVGQVTRSFAIRVFADTCHDDVRTAGCCYGLAYLRFVFVPIIALFIVGHALFEDDIVGTEFVAHGFVDGVVCTGKLVGQMTLPSIAPSTVQASHLIGVRTGHKDALALGQREKAGFVLQENHGFFGTLSSCLSKFLASELRIVFVVGIRLVEQTEAILQAKDATGSIIDTAHRHLTFVHEFLQEDGEIRVIRIHCHIDTGVDGYLDGFLLVLGNLFTLPEIVDVCPVGHNHTVPIQVFLEPLGKEFVIGMDGHTVDGTRVDHDGQGTLTDSRQIRRKMLFTQVVRGDDGRCTVLATGSGSIAHVVLHAHGNMLSINVIRVFTLEASYHGLTHLGIHQRVFAKVFPHTWPKRIAHKVEGR